MWFAQANNADYALTGVGDLPAYFRVRTVSGYSQTAPLDQLDVPVPAYLWFGAYAPNQVAALRRSHPEVRIITVENLHPLRLTLSSPTGPPIDLTRLIPPETK